MVDGHTCLDTHKACLHIEPDNCSHTICTEVGITNRLGTATLNETFFLLKLKMDFPTKTVSIQPLEQFR